MSKTPALILAAASIVFLAIFAAPLFLNEIYIEHDVGAIFVPLRYFYAQCLQTSDNFLWIPNIYAGFYLHGEGQTGMAHPVHWALYNFLPFTGALDLEFILSYPFMFAGMILFLRRWKLPPSAILFGAFLYTFSGYSMASWLWMVHIAVLAHTPWLLWLIDIAIRDVAPRKIAWALVGIVVLTASQLLVSYPQMVYVTGLVEAFYALSIAVSGRKSPFEGGFRGMFPRRAVLLLTLLLTAKMLAVACAAIQVLPTLHVVQQSTRIATDEAFRLQQSLHPANLLCLVNPYLFQQRMYDAHGYQGIYGGATVIALALWLLLRWRRLNVPRVPVACFAIVALLGTILTLGQYGLLYTWLSSLPLLEYFRGPPRHGAMVHLGFVGLAAFALAEIASMKDRAPRREWLPLIALPVVAAVPVAFIVALRLMDTLPDRLARIEEQFAPTVNPFVGLALMVVATLAVIAAIRHWRYGLLALVLVTIADQGLYHLRHRTTENLDTFIAAIDVPDALPEYRIEPNWKPVYDVNGPLMKGYSMVAGLVSIEPARALDYKVDPYTLQLAGVKWLRARYGENEWLNEQYERGETWMELPNPMPRARFVTHAIVSNDPNTDIRAIDYTQTALVERNVNLEPATPGAARIVEDRPGKLVIQTTTPSQQLLVTTEAYHDGWRLTMDRGVGETLRVNGDFLGALVPAGTHELRFTFDPWSWRWGKTLTIAGLSLTAILFLASFALPPPKPGAN